MHCTHCMYTCAQCVDTRTCMCSVDQCGIFAVPCAAKCNIVMLYNVRSYRARKFFVEPVISEGAAVFLHVLLQVL